MSLKRVPDPELILFDLDAKVKWSFITKPKEWRVLPFKASSPLSLQIHRPGGFGNQVLLRQVDEGVPFLRYAFGQKVEVSFSVLRLLADHLEVRVGRSQCSRKDLLIAIAEWITADDSPQVAQAYLEAMWKADASKSCKEMKIDPITELAWEELDPEDKKEFGDVGKMIHQKVMKRKCKEIQTKAQKLKNKKRRRISAFARRALGRLPVRNGNPCSMAGTGSPGAADSNGNPGITRASSVQNPVTFDWGVESSEVGAVSFHFTRVNRPCGVGYMATCKYHAMQIPMSSRSTKGELRHCSRELASPGPEDEALDMSSRVLKAWCLRCASYPNRQEHMHGPRPSRDTQGFLQVAQGEIPTHAQLDDDLQALIRAQHPLRGGGARRAIAIA